MSSKNAFLQNFCHSIPFLSFGSRVTLSNSRMPCNSFSGHPQQSCLLRAYLIAVRVNCFSDIRDVQCQKNVIYDRIVCAYQNYKNPFSAACILLKVFTSASQRIGIVHLPQLDSFKHRHFQWSLFHYGSKVKNSSLAYNRREIRDKRPLGRNLDRNWCHLHGHWRPHMSFTSVVGQAENFSPCPYVTADTHGVMGCDQKGFTHVWK